MFMPGFSSPRVPVQMRVFIAISITLALAPILLPTVKAAIQQLTPHAGAELILAETTRGVLIGLMGRFFFLALEFVGALAATAAGFTNMPGIPIESSESVSEFAAFITLSATVLFFLTGQHWEVLRALLDSYRALPITTSYAAQPGLALMTDVLSRAFFLGLQIASPFIIYSIGINVLFGIANKLTPQIAVYFISLPFVIMGGLLVLYFIVAELLGLFMTGFAHWLQTG
jgi:flagellar biosynthesis protein FliR